jgi:hypothetical protein
MASSSWSEVEVRFCHVIWCCYCVVCGIFYNWSAEFHRRLIFFQRLLNSHDAVPIPVNPFVLNARVMCSEERGAIYSETLVLWEELQVH